MTIQDFVGKNNPIGEAIWSKKYQRAGETFDQWLDRVSGGDTDVRRLIAERKFLFGGRILSNRNLQDEERVTYSNCYVVSPPEDNLFIKPVLILREPTLMAEDAELILVNLHRQVRVSATKLSLLVAQ